MYKMTNIISPQTLFETQASRPGIYWRQPLQNIPLPQLPLSPSLPHGHLPLSSIHPPHITHSSAPSVPLPHTVVDFWQMVWQEKVSCIVLLTLNKEDGRGKLGERYYPDGLGTWCIGPFLVSTTNKTQCAHYTLRNISVQVHIHIGYIPEESPSLETLRAWK